MSSLALALFFAAAPCQIDGNVAAECSVLAVPENRAAPKARSIELSIAVVPAVPGKKTSGAIFVLAGGPGQAASALGTMATNLFKSTDRDLVFVDARGTGKSHPLQCDFGGSDQNIAGYFNDMLPADRIPSCRDQLRRRADLGSYTTRAIVEDIEAVRKHLGYAQIDLYGSSYGTRVAIELLRYYPKSLRVVILDGVAPPSLAAPSTYALDAERSLKGVFALCLADADCKKNYPNLQADYEKMMKEVDRGLELEVRHPKTDQTAKVKINRGFFGEIMRNFLYSPETYTQLPRAIALAARGDWKIFADLAIRYAIGVRSLFFGMFLSVSCTEDVPRYDLEAAKKEAAGTMLGPYRVELQKKACALWAKGEADPARLAPIVSDVPVLLISGELDPVTPPRFAEEVASKLTHARSIVFPAGSHFGDTQGCQEKLMVEAVRAGAVDKLDLACVAKVKRPPFALLGP